MTETLKPRPDDKILPCPFCGQQPTTDRVGENQRALMIECFTDGCVGPHVSYYGDAAAIAAWNRRAEPTPEALEAWAEWFDDPGKSPSVAVLVQATNERGAYTPGYLLREIARRLRAAREE